MVCLWLWFVYGGCLWLCYALFLSLMRKTEIGYGDREREEDREREREKGRQIER